MSKQNVIVGAGTMGSMIAAALQASGTAEQLTVLRRETSRQSVDWSTVEVVWLAVKPQDIKAAVADLPRLTQPLVISVMAGVSMKTIEQLTGATRIIRSMPNTPAKIGKGMTVWCASAAVTPEDKHWFTQLLGRYSKLLEVASDDWIDKATAVSGCGPAYVFAFAEALLAAARELGFSEAQARLLVTQTCVGAAALVEQSDEPLDELRRQVTSKGGTTAAALNALELSGFDQMWNQAIQAAYDKAKTLSSQTR